MDQSPIADLLFSPAYARLTGNLALIALLAALVFTVLALAHYGRAREAASTSAPPPWGLLIATWRDSMIITLLYVAEGLVYRASRFVGAAERGLDSAFHFVAIAEPILGLILMMGVFVIGYLRVRALSDWIAAQK